MSSIQFLLKMRVRMTTVTGFELGPGIYINTALPEDTAAYLRETPIE
jgi:galactose-1-phosphate uridylyltransferase